MTEYPLAWPSLMSIRITMKWSHNDQTMGIGTAFMLMHEGQAMLVTNRHNLSGRRSDTNQLLSEHGVVPDLLEAEILTSLNPIEWETLLLPLIDDDENPLWLEHPELGRRADVVALPLPSILIHDKQVQIFPYDLDNPGITLRARPSDGVSIVGFPFGRASFEAMPIWSRGYIASEPAMNYNNLPCFLIDARTKRGQSGSPVVAYSPAGQASSADGSLVMTKKDVINLLGIYSGRIEDGLDAGIVWKLDAIRSVVEHGISPTRDSVKE